MFQALKKFITENKKVEHFILANTKNEMFNYNNVEENPKRRFFEIEF